MLRLYASATPSAQPFYTGRETPASAYALEQRLQRAYRQALFAADLDTLLVACFGEGLRRKQVHAAEERLQYEVPELIARMDADELPEAAAALDALPLADFVGHVLKLERHLLQREAELATDRPDDKGHCRAAGLGKGQPRRVKLTPAKPEPVHELPKPILRTQRRKARYTDPAQLALWP
ncbi:hypothetical protein F0P96_10495 [Hymenobacter busanensis]|uniref:Uncharacterized protein n=1 Tax=Hymenobacter busanensis TaxID=2607656 RepID=A0A7L4ZXD7_9BACT|nr:hypothetical protein [Hymenobacter busanensis]KAA9333389.1 hypothetical protein F0P96_10495 [Hymenobacter busanensis]QHJ07931.1 hypothetical protein GUY19_11810 [Hymenobacter busanensis]